MSYKKQQLPNQEDLCHYLTFKLRTFKNIKINTTEIKAAKGNYYKILVFQNELNGVFDTLTINTVSYVKRINFFKLVFKIDKKCNADMKINADAIFQIFREIANTTKDSGEDNKTLNSVRIEECADEDKNKNSKTMRLAIFGESTVGASLIYTYLRIMEFIRAINDKYSCTNTATSNSTEDIFDGNQDDVEINNNMSIEEIECKKHLLEKKLKALEELKLIYTSINSKNTTNTGNAIVQPLTDNFQKPKRYVAKNIIRIPSTAATV